MSSPLQFPGSAPREPSPLKLWVAGARPRTLPAAVVPVAVGTSVAATYSQFHAGYALAALVVALALQIATNYANDYSDGIRGTDEDRKGPTRLVASGAVPARRVRNAAFIAFAVAAVVGTSLSLAVQPLLVPIIGVPAVLAGWFYTGGRRPYGYNGLGELAVFVFFGLVATMGSEYVQSEKVTDIGLLCATACGLLAVGLLVANNLRDIDTDRVSGKRTLAVRLGDKITRGLYVFCVAAPFLLVLPVSERHPLAIVALLAAILVVKPIRAVLAGARGAALIAVLGATGRAQLLFGALLSGGMWL